MKATPGGPPPPHGRSSRASAQKYPVFGFAGARIEDWRTGLVHEQLGGPLQIGDQSVEDRAKLECRLADPVGERRAVEINALAAHDLGLPVER